MPHGVNLGEAIKVLVGSSQLTEGTRPLLSMGLEATAVLW